MRRSAAAALCLWIVVSCASRDTTPVSSPSAQAPPQSQAVPPAPVAAGANETADHGPAARHFAAWLSAFNDSNRAELAAFRDKLSPELRDKAPDVDGMLGFREQTGGFELKRVEESTPTRYV